MSVKNTYLPNKPDWLPNENDYVLVFMPVDCIWREVGHEIPKYINMTLADYQSEIGLYVPDYTQFLRIVADDYCIEYRAYDCMRVTIHYQKNVE